MNTTNRYNLFLIVLSFFFAGVSFAEIYPAKTGQNTDLIVIHDQVTDLQVRLALFKKAKHSIEIISHTHTSGVMGMAITNGLREALKNGIEVHYLYERMATMFAQDLSENTISFLNDVELPHQAEMIAARPLEKFLSTPFSLSDFFHQKIIIIDRGTPDEVIMTGGRNHDELNLRSADLSYVFRRVQDNDHANIMDDLLKHYDDTLKMAHKYFSVEKPKKLSKKQKRLLENDQASHLDLPIPTDGQAILDSLEVSPKSSDQLAPYQFRPEFFRLVTNDALKNIETRKSEGTKLAKGVVNDDITNYLSHFLESANKVELNAYIMMMPPAIIAAIKGVVSRNGEAIVYTNNAETYGRLVPIPKIGKIAEGYNHETAVELAKDAKSPDQVSIYMFDASRGAKAIVPIEYSHRKLAVIRVSSKDANQESKLYSWLGSYNFTYSSAMKNDEMGLMTQDNRLGKYMSQWNALDAAKYHVHVSHADSMKAVSQGKFMRAFCRKAFSSIF